MDSIINNFGGIIMINFAHRGASSEYPENTMLAFEEAVRIGADGIELDVHKSSDGKLIVIHDEDVRRTHLGNGLVKDFTLKEIKTFKCRKKIFRDNDKALIPTLNEVLELLKNTSLLLNIELKTDIIQYEDIEQDVINLVKEYGVENRVMFSSFHSESIVKCKEIDSSFYTGFLFDKKVDEVVNYAKKIKADGLHPNYKLITQEMLKSAHKNNLKVIPYTVNNPNYMKKAIDLGIDGVFTDYTGLLKEIIAENRI